MRNEFRFHFLRSLLPAGAVAIFLCFLGAQAALSKPPAAPPVTTINANQGTCSAAFVVKNGRQKPIYDAQIDLTFRYGFLNLHKESLEVYTNSDGKAQFTGLPNFIKRPLEFDVQYGDRHKTVSDNPGVTCDFSRSVVLP